MGRHPAAVGVLDPGAAPARLPARAPVGRGGDQGPRGLPGPRADARRHGAPARGLPVAGLGHLPGRHRAARRRRRPGRSRRRARGRLAARRGDPGQRRLGGEAARVSSRAAGPSSSPTTATPTSTTPPRSCSRCAGRGPTCDRTSPPRSSAARAGLVGMQSRDGGWGAFDADNTRRLVEKLPFCDFGAVIDPPSADVTAHAVEMLGPQRPGRQRRARGAASPWLLDAQEPDGSWFGRWGANYVYGTGAVVPALVAAGIAVDDPAIRRAVRWLEQHQNADGGWGEDLRSYADRPWRGRGASTPSQTAWALLALLAAGEDSDAVDRGVGWLLDTQRADGGWDEDLYTGTGFPGDFYINYEMYRLVFPLSALGRYLIGDAGCSDERPARRHGAAHRVRRAGRARARRDLERCGMGPERVRAWLPRLAELVAGRGRGRRSGRRAWTRRCARVTSWSRPRYATSAAGSCCAAPLRSPRNFAGWVCACAPARWSAATRSCGGAAARAKLAATGALAVDMESAEIVRATQGIPTAVVRVIVDTAFSPVAPARHDPGGCPRAACAARRRAGVPALGRPRRSASGAARRTALVLRRRRARDRHRRARAAALPAPGLRPPPDRAQRARGRRPGEAGRGVRRRTRPGARRHDRRVLRARRRAGGPPGGRDARAQRHRRRPARSSRRCTPRRGGSSAAATPWC